MDADTGDPRHRKRVRRAAKATTNTESASEQSIASTARRPTAAERQEALDVIQMMRERDPPIVPRRGQPPKPNVVACAIALHRGEVFESDSQALGLFFWCATHHRVRATWVNGSLAEFAPAGLANLASSR